MTDLMTYNQAKFNKAEGYGYFNAGHHFAPAKLSGKNVCGNSSKECRRLCLNESGQGEAFMVREDGRQLVQEARIWRTNLFFSDKVSYVDRFRHEISLLVKRAKRMNLPLCIRPNATSDLSWETLKGSDGLTIFEAFPQVQFYDYTKHHKRALAFINGDMPENYHLTFSRDERGASEAFAKVFLAMGGTVALCLRLKKKAPVPKSWHGFPCVDGDIHDLRFQDAPGSVVVLRPKGSKALKALDSGFVIRPENWVD